MTVINIVYPYSEAEGYSMHKGACTVIWSRRPLADCDVCGYLDPISYCGAQRGVDVLIHIEPIVVLPGTFRDEIWEPFDIIFTPFDALLERGGKFRRYPVPIYDVPHDDSYTRPIELGENRSLLDRKYAICMINGNKSSAVPGELYSKRAEVAFWFDKYSDTPFDVYGTPPFDLPNYRGKLTPYSQKFDTLRQYRFSLAFENIYHPVWSRGYFADRMIDCLMCGTIPIYLGCYNVEDFVPAGCFIDYRQFKDNAELDSYLQSISQAEYREYSENISEWVNVGNLERWSYHQLYDRLLQVIEPETPGVELVNAAWQPGPAAEHTARAWHAPESQALWAWADLENAIPSESVLRGEYTQKESIIDSHPRLNAVRVHPDSLGRDALGYDDEHIASKATANYVVRGRAEETPPPFPKKEPAATVPSPDKLVGIIFSKDRAMQLDATLRSFALHCTDPSVADLKVLYAASSPLHEQQYLELESEYAHVDFVREKSFKEDLLALLQPTRWVLFLCDDDFFVRDFDLMTALQSLESAPHALGFSLRLGKNTTYEYMSDQMQTLPNFEHFGDDVLSYPWTEAELDFGYPLELGSSVYRVYDLFILLNLINFQHPNTLEALLDANKNYFRLERNLLLCYTHSAAFSYPINVVQDVIDNRRGDKSEYSIEALAGLFADGYHIDVEAFSGLVPAAVHQEVELAFWQHQEAQRTRARLLDKDLSVGFIRPPATETPKLALESLQRFTSTLGDPSAWPTPDVAAIQTALAGSEYLLLLSPDIIVSKDWLDNLLAVADTDFNIAAVGPTSNLAPATQQIESSYADLAEGLQAFAEQRSQDHTTAWEEVPFLSSFCLLLKSQAVRQVGGLNTELPLAEAIWDVFNRFRESDFKLVCAQGVHVHHYELTEDEGVHFDEMAVAEQVIAAQLERGNAALARADLDAALDEFEALTHDLPDLALAHAALGQTHLARSEFDHATTAFRKAVKLTPTDSALRNQLGIALFQDGKAMEAESIFWEASALAPESVDALLNLVELYRAKENFSAAASCVKSAIELAPGDPDVLASFGALSLELGDEQAAKIALIHLQEQDPEHALVSELMQVLALPATNGSTQADGHNGKTQIKDD